MKPWWPDLRIPDEAGSALKDGQSGSIVFTPSNVAQFTVGANLSPVPTTLCSADFPRPTPVVLQLSARVRAGGGQGLAQQNVELLAGCVGIDSNSVYAQGFFVIAYGSGSTQQRAVVDMRQGSYALPPCQQVRVGACAWYSTFDSGTFRPSVEAAGALVEGLLPTPSRATNSFQIELAAGVAQTFPIPDGARDVDAWCGGVTAIGAGKPVLTVYAENDHGGGPFLSRDYSLGVAFPPYPASCINTVSSGTNSRLTIVSTVDTTATVQFGIEF